MKEKIEKANVQEVFELNPVQKGILYHYLKNEGDNVYNVQLTLAVNGMVDVDVLSEALSEVQSANEALRSVFRWEETGNPLQIILKNCPVELEFQDASQDNDLVGQYLEQDRQKRFDLTRLPLRVSLIRKAERSYLLVITHHHILYDGWSTGIFLQELFAAYHGLKSGRRPDKVLKAAYGDMLRDSRSRAANPGSAAYWKEYLKDYEITSAFPVRAQTAEGTVKVQQHRIRISGRRLESLAAQQRVTKAAVVYAAYGVLLRKFFNLSDIVFGTVVSNRETPIRGGDRVIGNFIQTVPVRFHRMEGKSLVEIVRDVNSELPEQNAYCGISYAGIKELLQLRTNEELFDSLLVVENYPLDRELFNARGDWQVGLQSAYENTGMPLLVTVFFGDEWEIEFAYQSTGTGDLDIAAFAACFERILGAMAEDAGKPADGLCLLSDEERRRVLTGFNTTARDYPRETTIVSLFDKQVAAAPHQVACRYQDKALTYRELQELSGKIGHYLAEQEHVRTGDLVGILLEREEYLVPAIFGTLRAGAAYVPIDPGFPAERINAILEDSGIKVLITRGRHLHAGIRRAGGLVDLDKALGMILRMPVRPPEVRATGRDVAYVIYTSGSTGRPKGVIIEHHSVVNRLLWMQRQYPIGREDVLLQKTPIVFDVSVWELFWWSFTGASLYVLKPGEEKEPDRLVRAIQENGVTTIHFVPGMLRTFLAHLEGKERDLPQLRWVFASGEALKAEYVQAFGKNIQPGSKARLINLYGPTEATVDVSWFDCLPDNVMDPVPIGRPIDNIQLYVLDKWRQPVPIGVAGELYIAGAGLARGYLNNRALTEEKFVDNPFGPAKKIYRTGDLVKWLPDGNIAFLGRIDYQVKIRGFRIELGEIESCLSLQEAITGCVVLAKEQQGDNYLVAYYTAGQPIAPAALSDYLRSRLPYYMVPAFFVELEKLPLTSNGKIDRKALPDPEISVGSGFVAPAGRIEEGLAEIWAEVLRTPKDRISVVRSFFEIGGHSLTAISLAGRIFRKWRTRIPVNDLFEHPDIRSLADYIKGREKETYEPIPKTAVREWYVLSSAQKRLYFLHTLEKTSTAYNGGVVVMLEGAIDIARIGLTFQKLIARHEALRTSFEWRNEAPVQRIAPRAELQMSFFTADEDTDAHIGAIINEFIRPFDLEKAPLMRVGLVRLTTQRHLLMVDVHHIIGDGVSQDILTREFLALYEGETLAEPVIQYKDYAQWQQGQQQESIAAQKVFWLAEFAERPEVLELPTDFERPRVNAFAVRSRTFRVDSKAVMKLKTVAAAEGATLFMAVLSVYSILLGRLGNLEDVTVGVPVAGREHPDLEGVMGMFVNTLPLRNYPRGSLTFRQFLASIRKSTIACLEHQAYPYEAMVDALAVGRNTSRNALFDVLLVYQDHPEPVLEIPGLVLWPYAPLHNASHFDLILSVVEDGDALSCTFQYAEQLFKANSIGRYIGYFTEILTEVAADPDIRLSGINMLPTEEKRHLVKELNATRVELPDGLSLLSLFDQRVKQAPHNTALIHGAQKWSYAQLDRQANAIAVAMQDKLAAGGYPGDQQHKIGLLFQPSMALSAGILAVIKCGFAYVPLSVDAPAERNRYIVTDAGVSLLLIQEGLYDKEDAGFWGATEDRVLTVPETPVAPESDLVPTYKASPDDLVYVIYTSGTTGRPKGVEVTYHNLLNYVLWSLSYHALTEKDRGLQLSPYHFDGFGGIFYRCLFSGGAMVTIPTDQKLNPGYIAGLIKNEQVTFSGMLPGLYDGLIDCLAAEETLPDLRFIILAGERAGRRLVEKSERLLPGVGLENEYGPTEATIGATHTKGMRGHNTTIIGKPVWNTSIYILGRNDELLPAGAKGEIVISGAGIARGYRNNDLLTSDKFIADPFMPGNRMYKTGDIGRWLPDGNIELLGRSDDQVKIRGFRVEPGEIEERLNTHPSIRESVVIVRENNGVHQLAAYYTAERELTDLTDFLAGRLPEYMIPAFFVQLEKLPYTAIGKLDRAALPDPEEGHREEYVPPVTEEEKLLAAVWQTVLDLPRVGITDNFFAIGGDSIRSIQISSRLLAEGHHIYVKDIFTHQTIRELAPKLKKGVLVSADEVVTGEIALTPIQQWFLENPIRNKHHFNQSVMLRFKGEPTETVIRTVFGKLLEHHDALRMSFTERAGRVVQENKAIGIPVSIEVFDVKDDAAHEQEMIRCSNRLQASIDLEKGPLMKLGLFRTSGRLLIVIHHLVIDGVSWRILLEDVDRLYGQIGRGELLLLPPKTHSYRAWSKGLLEFTRTALPGTGIPTAMPVWRDNPDGENYRKVQATEYFELDEETSGMLLHAANRPFHTKVTDLLLTALLLSIRQRYGAQRIGVDMEGHGREDIGADLDVSRTIGWFTTIYPVVLEARGAGLQESIQHVREALRRVPYHGMSGRVAVTSPICFNYLGVFEPETYSHFVLEESKGDPTGADEAGLYDWEISGMVASGRLGLRLTYSTLQYHAESMQAFMQLYKERLREVIAYCCAYGKTGLYLYPLSPMQEGLLFHSLMEEDAGSYFEQMTVGICGGLDITALEKTMNDLLIRHSVLRTVFLPEGYERPMQAVLPERQIDFRCKDIRTEHSRLPDRGADAKEALIRSYREKDKAIKFDVRKDVLIRMTVLRIAEDEYVCIWSHHHILMDGWCMGILLTEFKEIYSGHVQGRKTVLPAVRPYAGYIEWLEGRDKQRSIDYWREYLSGYSNITSLPAMAVSEKRAPIAATHQFSFDEEITKRLQALAAGCSVTLHTVLQMTWAILLARYNDTDDVVFGSVVSGRPPDMAEVERIVGLFINTIPVRVFVREEDTITDALQEVQGRALGNEEHQYTSLAEIQTAGRLGGKVPDHLLVFENYPFEDEVIGPVRDSRGKELFTISDIHTYDETNYDLVITVVPGNKIKVRIDYNANVFDEAVMATVATHWTTIAKEIVAGKDGRIGDIRMLGEEEANRLLFELNETGTDIGDETVIGLFERQVELKPDSPAFYCMDKTVTYGELGVASDRIAVYLERERGVRAGERIGVLMGHDDQLIPALLGILKTGAAYVPIDPDYPRDRIDMIIQDAGLRVLITRDELDKIPEAPGVWRREKVDPSALAYVIYTSGSTGRPKGVMIEHRSLANYIGWAAKTFVGDQQAVFALYSTIAFDLTVTSIFAPLTTGNAIVVYPHDGQEPLIERIVADARITTIKLTPSHLKIIRDSELELPLPGGRLRTLIVGGEDLETRLAADIHTKFAGHVRIYNEYGPTEATVGCMIEQYRAVDPYPSVPIGLPIDNMEIYVLDGVLRPVPIGVTGELYISGTGVARGYLFRDDLTGQRFSDNPFLSGKRMYRTGDLAVRLADGRLLYKGRKDTQVKIRGYRIELGEIEARLAAYDRIKEAVVTVWERDEEKYMVAYYVAKGYIEIAELRRSLSEQLPAYMLPAFFVELEKMPLSPNGKLDKKALPDPGVEMEKDYGAPSDETEIALAEIWSEILKIDLEKIGVRRSFWELGGHSLKAMTLAGRIRKRWGIAVSVKEVFQFPDISSMRQYIVNVLQCESEGVGVGTLNGAIIGSSEVKPYYPVSSAQKRLYFLHAFDQGSLAYNMPYFVRIGGEVDRSRLIDTFNKVIERHESLRTSFAMVEDEPVQKIDPGCVFQLEDHEAGVRSLAEIVQAFVRPFDLGQAPLMRAGLVPLGPGEQLLMVDMHHIISDGGSHGILMSDFQRLYEGEDLAPLQIHYKDYARWQTSDEQKERIGRQRAFWLNEFAEAAPVIDLPTDLVRPAVKNNEGSSIRFSLSTGQTDGLKAIARNADATLYMVLFSVYTILLSKLTGQEDIVIGTPVSGRVHADLEKIIGLFVNTLAIRTAPRGESSYREYLQKVRAKVLQCLEHREWPYEELINELRLERDTSRNPLFDVLFVYQEVQEAVLQIPGLSCTPYGHERTVSEFDITLTATIADSRVQLEVEYATALFGKETIERMVVCFQAIVSAILADAGTKIAEIEIIPEADRRLILHEFQGPQIDFDPNETVLSLFERQVESTPDDPAVKYLDTVLSYRELDERAAVIATYLQVVRGVQSGDRVALVLRRDDYLVPVIFGILKTGAVYVPVDPDFPADRMRMILEDSSAKTVIVQEDMEEIRAYVPEANVADKQPRRGDDLAYIIYTSGSTGRPKGVMIEHHSLLNIIKCMHRRYPLSGTDCYLLKTSYTFDVSAAEIFGWFPGGGSLSVLPAGAEGDPGRIIETIEKHGATHISFVPSMFSAFVEELMRSGTQRIKSLKYIFLAGEALPAGLVKKFHALRAPIALENIYGPTEGTIYSSGYSIRPDDTARAIPIGKPLDNVRLYVTDREGQLQPIGVPGELWISGSGVARAYLNKPILTRQKFQPDPFAKGKRLYRTGDWVRWLPDGNIEFLGRIDSQVKVRGFRIELGEIEYRLARHKNIKEVKVIAREKDEDCFLIAYYVAEEPIPAETLRNFLSESLPGYMLPAYYVHLTSLPVTPSGKLDHRALPEPFPDRGTDYFAPTGRTEERLTALWSEILGLDKTLISVSKSFFELGGHSLKATVLANKIWKEWFVEIPLKEIFRNQDIRSLAARIRAADRFNYQPIEPVDKKAYYPLSSAQRRLYFLYAFDNRSLAYNLPRVLELEGQPDIERLERAFSKLAERHESLRTCFRMVDGEPVQRIGEPEEVRIEQLHAGEEDLQELIRQCIRPFDLELGPLIRVTLIGVTAKRHILLVDMHHIIADGISQAILSRDLSAFYKGDSLPVLPVQYKDYAEWQLGSGQREKTAAQKEFWVSQHSEQILLELPTDHLRPAVKQYEGSSLTWWLDTDTTRKLNDLAKSEDVTLFMVLFSVYAAFLARIGNKEDIVIGVPVGGRNHPDLEEVMGMFVGTLAIRSRPRGELRYREFLSEVRSVVMTCFEHQTYPYEALIEELKPTRDTSRNPLFDVMFFFQNFDAPVPELPGLTVRPHAAGDTVAKFDLTLIAGEAEGRLFMNFEYDTCLFERTTIERFAVYLNRIVASVIASMDTRIAEIAMIPPKEMHQLIHTFNDTRVKAGGSHTIVSLFTQQVERTPDSIAVLSGEVAFSYAALHEKSDRIAACLRRIHGVTPGDRVGLMLERNQYLIPSLLGILKAGAAYVPVDPAYPLERINYLLEDSVVALVLTDPSFGSVHAGWSIPVKVVDAATLYHWEEPVEEVSVPISADDLAYMIYTSGSSGMPKGVMIRHSNVINFVRGTVDTIPFAPGRVMLCLTTISFDIFVLETIVPLLNGMQVVLAGSGDQREPQRLTRLIRERHVDYLQITPSHLKLLLDSEAGDILLKTIKVLMIGGEQLPAGLLKTIKESYTGNIYNMYGPTETTVWSSIADLTETDRLTIGRPIMNTWMRILDKHGQLLPVGVAGELYIGGKGVAKGYWKREQLTAERFVPDPLGTGEPAYRTGDWARWLPDGTIEFLGRMDHQVKIRGHRIELGEIEHHLTRYPQIKEAVVVAVERNGEQRLAAYYVPTEPIALPDLKSYLTAQLPAYMVPAYFMPLERLPLTPNGKLHRKALPDPVAGTGETYVPPSNKTEHLLVGIWAEVLKIDPDLISIDAGFFDLGGHSLNAIIIIEKIQAAFGTRLPLVSLFKAPTIREISKAVLLTHVAKITDHSTDKLTI